MLTRQGIEHNDAYEIDAEREELPLQILLPEGFPLSSYNGLDVLEFKERRICVLDCQIVNKLRACRALKKPAVIENADLDRFYISLNIIFAD